MAGQIAEQVNPQHPLEGLGLDIQNPDGSALLEILGSLPGAAEAEIQKTAQENVQILKQGQAPGTQTPIVEPTVSDPAAEFNRTFAEQANQGQESVKTPVEPENPPITRDDWDFLVGLVADQSEAMKGYTGGQVPAPGPSAIPATSFIAPAPAAAPAPVAAPQSTAQVPPIAVPELAQTEITEAEFEKINTDRTAMATFMFEREKKIAATVTETLASTVLPHIYTHMQTQFDEQKTIHQFLQANPDLAETPDALEAAVAEARLALPYAKADRLMYYAAQKLRRAMKANDNINASVHDLRGGSTGRRAPVVNNAQALRRGPGNEPVVNPFTVMKDEMKAHAANKDGDILQALGLA